MAEQMPGAPIVDARIVVAIYDDRVEVSMRPDVTTAEAVAELRRVADRLERGDDHGARPWL